MWATSLFILNKIRSHMSIYSANVNQQKSGRQTFRTRFVSGSIFASPCPPACYLQSETKIEPDLRLLITDLVVLYFLKPFNSIVSLFSSDNVIKCTLIWVILAA